MLVSIFPLPRVHILVGVGEDTLSIALVTSPVTVVGSYSYVSHLANAVLLVIEPSSTIDVLLLFSGVLIVELIRSLLTLSYLYSNIRRSIIMITKLIV